MGWRAFLVVVVVFSSTRTVNAESDEAKAKALVLDGEALGKAGKYDEALERFRRAESIHPRAIHDCYIAVALTRQKSLTRARYYLERCKSRSDVDPPVSWFHLAHDELARSMTSHGRLRVTVEADKAAVSRSARVVVTGFDDLVLRSGDVVWLPAGKHQVEVRHEGYKPARQRVLVVAGETIKITAALVAESPDSTMTLEATPPAKTPILAYSALGVGGAALIGAVAFHINGVMARSDAQTASDDRDKTEYQKHADRLVMNRAVAISLYVVSAAAVGTGTYLLLRDRADSANNERDLSVTVGVGAGSAGLVVGGRF